MNMNLKKKTNLLLANVTVIFISFFTTMLVPKYVSVSYYGDFREVMLYLSYIGVFGFGFIDALYLKYGGCEYNCVDKSVLKKEYKFIRNNLFVFSIIMISLGIFIKSGVILMLGAVILPYCIISFYKMLMQALGEYNALAVLNVSEIVIITILYVVVIRFNSYYQLPMFISNVVAYLIVFIAYEMLLIRKVDAKDEIKFRISTYMAIWKKGLYLLVSNLLVIVLFTIDKLLVKNMLGDISFSLYSYSASVTGFFYVFSSTIGIFLYNSFCKNNETDKVYETDNILINMFLMFIICYYPINWFTQNYISHFTDSMEILKGLLIYMVALSYFQVTILNQLKVQKKTGELAIIILIIIMVCGCVNYNILKYSNNYNLLPYVMAIAVGIATIIKKIQNRELNGLNLTKTVLVISCFILIDDQIGIVLIPSLTIINFLVTIYKKRFYIKELISN